jgi:PAS domain S-box-containing protein
LEKLITVNAVLAGFYAYASIHYAVHWWLSRKERVLLLFSIQCLFHAAFSLAINAFFRAKTIPEAQSTLDRFVTIGVLIHPLLLQLYAELGGRRDRALRVLVTGMLVFLAILNQWTPLRGTVVEMRAVLLPGGAVGLLPIRTSPGAALALLYLLVVTIKGYGFFVARTIWKRYRAGAILLAVGTAASLGGAALGILVDFANLRAPYAGALPHAIFVLCVTLFLSREYAARGARVAATERQFEAAFEHGAIGKALLTPEGRFLRVNRALCRLLAWTAAELGARHLRDVTHPDDTGAEERELRRLRDVPAYTVERRLLRKDGEPVWVLLALSVVPDDQGRPLQVVAQMHDLTELRAHRERLEELVATRTRELSAAKDEAERANRAKGDFLAHISHEIRNPLHVMLLCAQILEHDPSVGGAQQSQIGIMRSSGNHLLALMNDVLDMAKIEARRPELIEDRFDLRATLAEVERMFAGEAASKGIALGIDCAPQLPPAILGDGGKVKQVLINLAGNALKFTNHGSVRFKAFARPCLDDPCVDEKDGAVVVGIAVADTGIGIAEQDTVRIFQPFEQLDAGKRAGGTGLGLAISVGYARLMGGDLTVESTPGIGTTFTFMFVAKRASIVEVVASGTRSKVLIVDDLAVNRETLSALLSGPRFETRTASDGPSAISIHTEWRPDLVLMDLRMPGMGGLDAIRRLRADGSRAAIGALSSSALAGDERQALLFGADFFLGKPFEDRVLMDRIARALVPPTGGLRREPVDGDHSPRTS